MMDEYDIEIEAWLAEHHYGSRFVTLADQISKWVHAADKRGRLTERERCAKIAEDWVCLLIAEHAVNTEGEMIAAEIRKGLIE